ncbi:5102_t:CDS:2 [Gigaspora margarita]|uniref:5102_t:CDS:1 n=1 Tax=Gigaspora margarita TaxID=4874 RepID=A0ABN7V470_GIGMA|nr:5102_t:CDS:2 [Gigaspora margarita]
MLLFVFSENARLGKFLNKPEEGRTGSASAERKGSLKARRQISLERSLIPQLNVDGQDILGWLGLLNNQLQQDPNNVLCCGITSSCWLCDMNVLVTNLDAAFGNVNFLTVQNLLNVGNFKNLSLVQILRLSTVITNFNTNVGSPPQTSVPKVNSPPLISTLTVDSPPQSTSTHVPKKIV